ncbi:MAG: class I SAM-dependent methyltransferase [Magnetococcales bacterium]|nr:class I SAM-dependent methyltransferase [Magnetococcales bacterium]
MVRFGGLEHAEINGDTDLTQEESRLYARMRWREIRACLVDSLPLERIDIGESREFFRELLQLEPAASPGRHYTNLALNLLARQYCPPRADILDVGCGGAGFVKRLEQCSISGTYLGVDIQEYESWHAVRARLGPLRAGFVVSPAEHLDLHDRFDFVLCSHSLEHQEWPLESLRRIRAALKPGAYGVFFVPAPWSYLLYGPHGWRYFSRGLLDRSCREAGFQVEKIYGMGGFFSFLLHLVFIAWLETALIFDVLAGGRVHWRLRQLLQSMRFQSIRKNRISLASYRGLSRILLTADRYLPRPHHSYCIVVRRPTDGER